MDFASIQAQLANLTAQLTHNAERTSMPSVPTLDAPYGQRYQTYQYPQFSAYEDAWGYQGYDQSRGNMYSNACNSNWRDYSNQMWDEPQYFQQGGYWQQDEFYSRPMQPPQHPPQSPQFNSGTSLDNDTFNKLLSSLNQGVENQIQEMQDRANKVDKLEKQVGQIMEIMAQIQDQSEFSNSTFASSKAEVEFDEAISLEGDVEDEVVPEPSKHSPNMDELLLQAEDEEDDLGSLDEFLSQTPQVPMSSNSGEEVLSSIHSNFLPSNVLFPCRILIPNIEESEKDIVEALPKVQSDIPTLGAPKQVPEPCTPRKEIQENEVAGECVKCIKEAIYETTKPKEMKFDDTGQVTTIVVNLATCKVPATFKDVVFVIEFVSEQASKPSSPISISFYTYMLLMIQAPTQEFKPLPDHFNYHRPFIDKGVLRPAARR